MEQLIYTKYSDERSEKFSLYTQILKTNENKFVVRKYAETEEGKKHLQYINHVFNLLNDLYDNTAIKVNQCKVLEKGLEFEYILGETYEQILDKKLMNDGVDAVITAFEEYFERVIEKSRLQSFYMTDDFKKIFGECELPQKTLTLPVSDIDMITSNMLCNADGYYLIDYEWSFTFPIPVNYLIYRTLHYYMECSIIRKPLKEVGLYQRFGITKEEEKIFQKMEINLQKYISGERVPIREMYRNITPGIYDVVSIAEKLQYEKRISQMQIFYSFGKGYTQDNSYYYKSDNNKISLELDLPKGVTDIRIDPGDAACICRISKLTFDVSEEQIVYFDTIGIRVSESMIIYGDEDPQLTICKVPNEAKKLYIEYEIFRTNKENLKKLYAGVAFIESEKEKLEQTNRVLQKEKQELLSQKASIVNQRDLLLQQINAMENTKVWKMYKKYRKLRGRE